MMGYNVIEMYFRTIGILLLAFKRYVEKITLGSPHFSKGENCGSSGYAIKNGSKWMKGHNLCGK